MAFDIPRDVILKVDDVEVRLDRSQHPFERAHEAEIEANWTMETKAQPALFDGRVALLSHLVLDGRRLVGMSHAVRYATFLYWRRHKALDTAQHVFAHAALVTSDGALLAIRMGSKTVNAGHVYFAAGSFEPEDFGPDGLADLAGNMAREVREETGLTIAEYPRDPGYHAFSQAAGTVLFRRYYLDIDAATAASRIAAFVAAEPDPEIEGPVIIRGATDLPEGILPHMVAIVCWHFATVEGERLTKQGAT